MSNDRPQPGLAIAQLAGVLMVIIGLCVGLTSHTTSQYGGADCGSVLGGGGEDLTTTGVAVCGKALSAPTTWTWLLLILGVLTFLSVLIIDRVQRNAAPRTDASPV